MRAVADAAAVVHDHDLVHVHDGAYPLGDQDQRGIAVMLLGLIAVVLSQPIAARLPQDRRDRAAVWIKLAGVLICAVGAMMVFYC